MINIKDVITLRVPYPDVASELAKNAHMYICVKVPDPTCELVKCQRFKPYHAMPNSSPVCRIVEPADASRNPFLHPTVIDLDKLFIATRSLFPDNLKTAKGVCDALFAKIQANITAIAIMRVSLSDTDLQVLNHVLSPREKS